MTIELPCLAVWQLANSISIVILALGLILHVLWHHRQK